MSVSALLWIWNEGPRRRRSKISYWLDWFLENPAARMSHVILHIYPHPPSPSKLVFSQNSTVVLSFPFCLFVFCYNLWKTCHVPGGPYGLWLCMAWRWCTQQTHQPPTLHGNKFWMNCLKSIPMLGKIGGQTVFHTGVVVWLLWQNGTFFLRKKRISEAKCFHCRLRPFVRRTKRRRKNYSKNRENHRLMTQCIRLLLMP